MPKKKRARKKDYLLFIDTNIYLDFYRGRSEASLKLLNHLDKLHDRIISTYQVEMEFKKNRQAAIIYAINSLKAPEKIAPQAFLSEAITSAALKKDIKNASSKVKSIKARLMKILNNPTINDPVYKVIQRIFRKDTAIDLTRTKNERFNIRKLAKKRFYLGYPPRKSKDTCIGDAINWEWIVNCGKETGKDIIIVSRDSDYGTFYDNECFINDWLIQEFRDRVSKSRHLILTDKLSKALKELKINVGAKQEQEESQIISSKTLEMINKMLSAQYKAWMEAMKPPQSFLDHYIDALKKINDLEFKHKHLDLWQKLKGDFPESDESED